MKAPAKRTAESGGGSGEGPPSLAMDERGRIAMLARVLGARAPGVEVGIGDDAAVLDAGARATPRRKLVWTIDEQVEGTHFRRDLASWRDVGWRSFMAAASDVAAMGAEPWCALAAIVVPDDVDDEALEQLAQGQRAAADVTQAPIVGGNLARGPVLSVATTFLGACERPVERRGARPGDRVWVAGKLGLAAAGLRAIERGRGGDAALEVAIAAWRAPRALVVQGKAMAEVAHAAVDVSDGLARDVGHIAEASDVCVEIDEEPLLNDPELAQAAAALGESAVALALQGGEDYALVATSNVPIAGFRCIGRVGRGRGVALKTAAGRVDPIEPCGYDHFVRNCRPRGA